MAHEKVYGICENKCKARVIPHDNIMYIETYIGASVMKQYPFWNGWGWNNTVVISIMVRDSEDEQYWAVPLSNLIEVKFSDDATINLYNHGTGKYVRIVLMKVE